MLSYFMLVAPRCVVFEKLLCIKRLGNCKVIKCIDIALEISPYIIQFLLQVGQTFLWFQW